MIIWLLFIIPIYKSGITTCSVLDVSQTTILPLNEPSQVFEMTYDDPSQSNHRILNFGIWMKWQPQSHQKDIEMMSWQCEDQFLYSLKNKIENKILFFLYQIKQTNAYDEKFKLGLKSHYFQSNELGIFTFDYVNIEGVWLFFYFLYDVKKKEISFIIYHYELKEKQEIQLGVDLPFHETLIHKVGGIEEEIVFDGQKLCFSKFLGRLSTVFTFQNEINFDDSINECYNILDDCKVANLILTENYQLKGTEFLSFQTFVLEKNIYSIYGWFRMDYNEQITEKQSLLRITNDFNENSESSQYSIELQFQIYQENQQAEINFQSFQYDMISGIPTISYKSFRNENYFLVFQQWHFIQINIGIPSSKAILHLFSSQLSQEIYIELETNSYTGVIYFISVGGSPSKKNFYYGQIQDIVFESFCKTNEKEFIPKCHYSCFECKGPFKDDCISCEANYYRFLFNNLCECQQQTIDIGISQCFDIADYQGKILEYELVCNQNGYDICKEDQQIFCSFGYFYYKTQCIQCPYYDEEKYLYQIYCLNCLLFPENFSITLECSEDAYAFESEQQNTYNIQKREDNFINYFEIISTLKGTFDLQELSNQKNKVVMMCKNGQYLSLNECFPCPDFCDQCNHFLQCNNCKYGFYLNENKKCVKCQEGCEQCVMKYDEQVCFTCVNEFYLNNEKKCQPCGQYCADCNRAGFCNYCKDPSKFFISLDGINCLPCNIKGCQFCYQLIDEQMSSFKINYNRMNLETLNEVQKIIYCSKCEDGLVLNIQDNECVNFSSNEICLFGNNVNQQFECLSDEFYIPSSGCNNFEYCEKCTKNQCIQCMNGYFLDVLFKTCLKCLDNCEICLQQYGTFQDAWKNQIFPFYFYLESIGKIASLYKKIINLTQKEDYEIICIQCNSGYIKYQNQCIKGCNEDCETCEVINSKAICIKCKSIQGKYIRSLDSEGQCLQCPDYCAACYEVNSNALNLRNEEFIITNSNIKYLRKCFQTQKVENGLVYLNTYFSSAIKCQNHQKCSQKVIFEWNLKCSPDIQMNSHLNGFYNIDEFFNKEIFKEIEKEEIYTLFNDLNVQEIDFIINLISNDQTTCQFPSNVKFISFFKKKVFSLLQFNFKIIGQKKLTKLSEIFLNINGFNQIEFVNLKFQSTKLQFHTEFDSLIIFSNCRIQSYQDDNPQLNFQLISNNNYNLLIENLEIKNCVINDLNLFFFEVTSYNFIPQITIINLQIFESRFINTNFLYIKTEIESKYLDIQMHNLIFQKSNLHNSSMINSQGSQILTAILSDIKINQFNLTESSFFILTNIFELKLSNGEMITGIFNNNSNFILANQFEGNNILFEYIQINDSSLFNYNFTPIQSVTQFQTINIKLENIQVTNTSYNNQFSIIKQVSKENQRTILNLTNFKITSTKLDLQFEDFNVLPFLSIIHLECQICILDQIEIVRDYGLPEIRILNSQNVFITNSIFTQNQLKIGRMLHSDINCYTSYQQKLMQYFLFIQQYQNLAIDNLTISNTFAFNNPLILIQGLDSLSKYQNEQIEIQNSQFLENMMITSSQNSLASIFSISSSQDCLILFQNLTFKGNHLNSINEEIEIEISTTLLVLVIKANVVIANCKFYENIITNSSSSILTIKATSTEIRNSIFEKTNILNFEKLAKVLKLDTNIITTNQLKQAFLIKSQGGCGKFLVQNFTIYKIFVNQTSSACGGTFYLQTINDAIISITNSYFESSSTIQDFSVTTLGGLFFIDSQFFQLNFQMINCSIYKSYSRLYGGSIYLNASAISNQIIFKQLKIKNIFSQQGTFLYCKNIFSKSITNILIDDINFSNSQDGLYQYLSTLKNLIYYEGYSIFLQSSIFILNNVNFTMKSSQFQADQSLNIATIQDLNEIYLSNIYVGYSFFSNSILFIFFKKDYNGIVQLQNITIENIVETQISETNGQCSEIDDSFPLIFSCGIEEKELNQNIQIHDNIILIQNNQLICNLKVSHFNFLFITSILTFYQFYQQIQFLATNVIIKQVICQDCQYGLMSFSQTQQKSENNLIFKEVNINKCNCGNQACISILGEGMFDSDILYQDLLGQRRLTQKLDEIILYEQKIKFQAIFSHCHFYNNQGLYGGGILIAGINTLIEFSTFIQNQAGIGGAVYTINFDTNTYFYKCQFAHNTAKVAGGIFLNKQPIQYANNSLNLILDNNSTFYGNNIVEIPVSLAISFNDGNTILPNKAISSISNSIIEYAIIKPFKIFGKKENVQTLYYPSGQQIGSYLYIIPNTFQNIRQNLTFRIIAQNSFGEQQNILQDSNCTLSIKVINQTSQLETFEYQASLSYYNKKFSSDTGDYNLDNLIIEFDPYYDQEIVLRIFINSDAIKIPIYEIEAPYLIKDYITNYTLFVDVKTFPCQAGEFFNSKNGACYQCDITQFQYQVKQNSTICEFKDEEKIDAFTPSMIQLKQFFWRPFYYSQIIEKCAHLVGNCMGGWIAGDTSCYMGHIGALCEQCDLYNIRGDGQYSIKTTYKCGSCNQVEGNILSIFFISLWTLFSIFLSVHSQYITNEKFSAAKRLRVLNIKYILKEPSTAVLIKILTNYIQIISTLQTFQLQVPDGLTNFFQVLGSPLEQMAYSLDCFLISITNISIIYFRVIWSLNMAFTYICVYLIIFQLLMLVKLIIFDITYISSAFIYIFIFLQPNIIKELISLASFRTISQVNWIQANVAYQYDTQSHQNWLKYLCLPVFIVLALIIPYFLFFNVFKNRRQLQIVYIRKVWGYLYNEYKFSTYYWEFIKLFQKDFIVIVLAYYDDFIPIKASLVFLCIFSYSLISTYESPYLTGELNKLDIQSITVCAVSIILGSSIYLAQQNALQEVIWSFYFVIIILNLILFIKLVFQIVLAYFEKIYDLIEKFKEILLSQQRADSRYYPFLKKLFESRKTRKQRIKERFAKIKQFLIYEAKQIIKQKQSFLLMTEMMTQHQRYSLIQQNLEQFNSNQKQILKIQFL